MISKHNQDLTDLLVSHLCDYQGQLGIILGTMFSGKSAALIQVMNTMPIDDGKKLLIRYKGDNRESSISRDPDYLLSKDINVIHLKDNLLEYFKSNKKFLRKYKLIGIDEAQFLLKDIDPMDFINEGITEKRSIVLSGISSDLPNLDILNYYVPYCDQIIKLQATCSICRKPNSSIYHMYLGVHSNDNIDINDDYLVLCSRCSLNKGD